jgi:4-alpha-glucanotransferase
MAGPRGLQGLARLHGIQAAYHDNDGRRVPASPEALMEALRALRVPLRDAADVPRLLEERRRELWERVLEPVVVAWSGAASPPNTLRIRIPARLHDRALRLAINFEDGQLRRWEVDLASLEAEERAEVGGSDYLALRAPLPAVPPGYHDLHLSIGERGESRRYEALLIGAPRRAATWDAVVGPAGWGLFSPLYALWEQGADGGPVGPPSFRLLERLAATVAHHGGAVVGTLPLLAAFLDEPYEPSPYTPVSRLFWNELYVTPPAGPEPWSPAEDAGFYPGGHFDARAAMAAKRPALAAAARSFFDAAESEPLELESFRARNPRADDYARFRALVERHGEWDRWQDRLRGRDVRAGDYDHEVARYHLYAQWLAERQMTTAKERAGSLGVGLYLDLPLGVHPLGYDVWRDRELFAVAASSGAPPDALAATGQDWGFPPLHPEALRFDGHRYFIASIRKQLRFASVLRIDHVMQLTRMYWVVGADARDGVYVRYPAEELYAVLCLESRRARAVIVGEDLGTVPRQVRRDMRRHGLPGMYVGQFELTDADEGQALVPKPVPAGTLASIGTHDTPTFAGWWTGRDAEIRAELGQTGEEEAAGEVAGRGEMRRKLVAGLGLESQGEEPATADHARAAAGAVHRELLRHLGRSGAGLVLATMEDLWLETEPQNVPGTLRAGNWSRPARRPIEALGQPDVVEQLDVLNTSREGPNE